MAHESFEDQETAADLARWFVSVKVDREERPDLDTVYMAATQALTGSGGWPMSVFCTPDGRPFYAGTYFPPVERHGMPPFRRVVAGVGRGLAHPTRAGPYAGGHAGHGGRRELHLAETLKAEEAAAEAAESPAAGRTTGLRVAAPSWQEMPPGPTSTPPSASAPSSTGCARDSTLSGVASARRRSSPGPRSSNSASGTPARRRPRRTARHMARRTLDAMAAGGLYDHIVGGFCRYSTDARWLVPHFEKMLTDQALLARAVSACLAGGRPRATTSRVVSETLDWVLRDLSTPEGALYSSFDADAGGVEGATPPSRSASSRRSCRPSWSGRRPSGTASPKQATGRAAPFPSARWARPCTGRPR